MSQIRSQRPIGDILKTFGAHGEVIVKVREDIPSTILRNKEPIFIYIDGLSVPFYMKFAEPKGTSKLVVIFEDMETEALATELVGKSIFLTSEKAPVEMDSEFNALVGFAAIDKKHGSLGVVTGVMDIPGNPCLVAEQDGRELIIPLNEELIVKIDSQKQQIYLNVPDGLLELYS